MKKIIVILLAVLAMSCRGTSDEVIDSYLVGYLGDFNLTENAEWDSLETQEDVFTWLDENIEPRVMASNPIVDPQVTIDRGWGDCKAFSMVYMNIVWYRWRREPELAFGLYRQIVEGGEPDHCFIIDEGVQYEPQTGEETFYPIGFKYGLWEVYRR